MDFFEDCVFEQNAETDNVTDFVHATSIWINQPHVVDKRLNCAIIEKTLSYNECIEYMRYLCKDKKLNPDWQRYISTLQDGTHVNRDVELQIFIRKLIPKRTDIFSSTSEMVILGVDGDNAYASFIVLPSENSCASSYNYQVSFRSDLNKCRIQLRLTSCPNQQRSLHYLSKKPRQTTEWLKSHLMPKLIAWTEQQSISRLSNKTQFPVTTSISLVEKEDYATLYQDLKLKYGKKWIQIWPEKTDPFKFVYEDVSIATYILLLWKAEREEKGTNELQSFVDLGCGNGLLVHILRSEGHPGKGIDIRRRKIWDFYGSDTVLEVKAFVPSNESIFSETDWIIGNHCDELTPWIPVIAARSSYNCHYFVLPCCPYDFNGKFSRRHAKESQYRAYLNYIYNIGKTCGFDVEEDRLRLPSTKRICHIGRKRTYESSESATQNRMISEMLSKVPSTSSNRVSLERKHINSSDDKMNADQEKIVIRPAENDAEHQQWSRNFKPREPIELTSNCKQLSRSFKDEFAFAVASRLLELPSKRVLKPMTDDQENDDDSDRVWNKGGELTLDAVASLFEKPTMQQLKKECGGIKTLLKLFHQVFIVSGNKVKIRDWSSSEISDHCCYSKCKSEKEKLYKTKLCWFYTHHPDGCPLNASTCSYAHGESELKERPNFNSS